MALVGNISHNIGGMKKVSTCSCVTDVTPFYTEKTFTTEMFIY